MRSQWSRSIGCWSAAEGALEAGASRARAALTSDSLPADVEAELETESVALEERSATTSGRSEARPPGRAEAGAAVRTGAGEATDGGGRRTRIVPLRKSSGSLL